MLNTFDQNQYLNSNFGNIYNLDNSNTLNTDRDWTKFSSEIVRLGNEIEKQTGLADYQQVRKMERWGRLATLIGYGTSWLIVNPISILLIALGNYTRWITLYHPLAHGALDSIEAVPNRYKSHGFAQGMRRFIDWPDWITPSNWHTEHNILHHHHLGTYRDPDIVWRNTQLIRTLNVPRFIKSIIALLLAATWKFTYYAPNTLIERKNFQKDSKCSAITLALWNPLTKIGFENWTSCLLPYFCYRFILIPSLFLFIGVKPALFVLINSIFAEFITNIYSFATIATNHTGDDLLTFSDPAQNKADFYLRQILGTTNFPAGNDFIDFLYGGMNYQIEHHLWPNASLLQYQRVRPKLKKLCQDYGVPYHEEALALRVSKLYKAIVDSESKQPLLPPRERSLC
jgi:fatty acid desaturase